MSFIGRLRVLGCLAGLRDDACQNVESLGASFGVELLARRWSRRRGRFEKGQGQLHGNSPHWPLALGAEKQRLRRASMITLAWSKSASEARQGARCPQRDADSS